MIFHHHEEKRKLIDTVVNNKSGPVMENFVVIELRLGAESFPALVADPHVANVVRLDQVHVQLRLQPSSPPTPVANPLRVELLVHQVAVQHEQPLENLLAPVQIERK